MNHIEALKICRNTLKSFVQRGYNDFDVEESEKALAATAVIDPVAVSIDSKKFQDLAINWSNEFSSRTYKASENTWLELTKDIDAHCAAQVAQAESAALHEAQNADEWRSRAMKAEQELAEKS